MQSKSPAAVILSKEQLIPKVNSIVEVKVEFSPGKKVR